MRHAYGIIRHRLCLLVPPQRLPPSPPPPPPTDASPVAAASTLLLLLLFHRFIVGARGASQSSELPSQRCCSADGSARANCSTNCPAEPPAPRTSGPRIRWRRGYLRAAFAASVSNLNAQDGHSPQGSESRGY
uniref:Uncharacterized protein n=1 Tax=Oryza meridionalis TaxID=40149 RepID=A0A0E0EZJ6_9ORYZ